MSLSVAHQIRTLGARIEAPSLRSRQNNAKVEPLLVGLLFAKVWPGQQGDKPPRGGDAVSRQFLPHHLICYQTCE